MIDDEAAPVLSARGMSVAIDGRTVVDRVDLDLYAGRVLGIVGASGSGKTMAASALLGLLPPNADVAGSVRLRGRELVGLDERGWCTVRGRRIGLVNQDPLGSLTPTMTVSDQIAEAITIHRALSRREARDEAVALMESVGIPDARDRASAYPHEFSGGMRQRVAIAIAVANRPDVVIADEPTSALDATVGARILDLFDDLVRRHRIAMLVISHDQAVVDRLCDDTRQMRHGVLGAVGPAGPAAGRTLPVPAPSEGRPAILRVRDLTVRHRGRRTRRGRLPDTVACTGVGLDVRAGEAVALVGESGAGKSTVLDQVLRFAAPPAGSIELFGRSTSTLDRAGRHALRRRVGVVFQDPGDSLDPTMRVGESIAEPLRIHRMPVTDTGIGALLAAVGLDPDLRGRRPGELSGGQKQRVAIARALATDPGLLLLDEPVSALDAPLREEIMTLLHDLRARTGLGYLMVSHDLDLCRRYVDRIVVLHRGRVVTDADPGGVPIPLQPRTEVTR